MRTVAQAAVNGSGENVEEEIDIDTPGQITALDGRARARERAGARCRSLMTSHDAIDLRVSALGDERPDHTAPDAASRAASWRS